MKEYLAVYLPVEGEITWNGGKDEPLFYYDLNHMPTLCVGYRTPNLQVRCTLDSGTVFYEGHLRFKKAKLFLCSRDVKVGDKLQIQQYNGDPNWYATFDSLQDNPNFYNCRFIGEHNNSVFGVMAKDAIKVIGEISDDVKWVKEGDEFDKEDWICNRVFHRIECVEHDYPYSEAVYATDDVQGNHTILLNCPTCKHFH